MTSNELIAFLLICAAAVPAAVYLSWISQQSLLQALRLLRVTPIRSARAHVGKTVCLHGTATVEEPLTLEGEGEVLWYETVCERRGGRDSQGSWRHAYEVLKMAEFSLRDGGQEVAVFSQPTEVPGARKRTVRTSVGADVRIKTRWVPALRPVTVLGMLEEDAGGLLIGKKSKLGLLLTPRSPGRAAFVELLKGSAGIAAATLIIAVVVALYFSFSAP